MKAQVIKTSQGGSQIDVKWSARMTSKKLDGFVYGPEMVSICDSITISKDGNVIITASHDSLSTTYSNLPDGAYGAIMGHNDGGETILPLSEAVYNLITAALTEAKAQAESDCDKPEPKKEPELVINPAYSHMSKQEIKAAEQRYDHINNEGSEGYNPYRDNLYVERNA